MRRGWSLGLLLVCAACESTLTPPPTQGVAGPAGASSTQSPPPVVSDKQYSVQEKLIIPIAACTSSDTFVNVGLPAKNAATIVCTPPGEKAQAPFPTKGAFEIEEGTIILRALSESQVIIAADSRSGVSGSSNGRPTFSTIDDRCKLTELSPKLLFAAAGTTAAIGGGIPSNVAYDAHTIARSLSDTFSFDQSWEGMRTHVEALAERWGFELAFRISRGIETGALPDRTGLTGIFAGLEPDGSISVAAVRLERRVPFPGSAPPSRPVAFNVAATEAPKDFTWIDTFGHGEIVRQYTSLRAVTEATRAQFERFRAMFLSSPGEFSADTVGQLMQIALKEEPHAYAANRAQVVGGPVDIARLRKGGTVEWISQKAACRKSPTK